MPRYTLWQGGQRIGAFDERGPATPHKRTVSAFGVLVRDAGAATPPSVMQARVDIFPGKPYLQHPLDTELIGAPSPSQSDAASSGPRRSLQSAVINPLGPDEAAGVPPQLRLEVRDAHDRPVDASMITVQHVKLAPGAKPPTPANEDEAWLIAAGECWMVSFLVQPPDKGAGA